MPRYFRSHIFSTLFLDNILNKCILNISSISLFTVVEFIIEIFWHELRENLYVCLVQARAGIREVHFLPFNPVDKRTALTYIDASGNWHRASKGAPEQVTLISLFIICETYSYSIGANVFILVNRLCPYVTSGMMLRRRSMLSLTSLQKEGFVHLLFLDRFQ